MSKLQRKCLAASAVTHGLLLFLFLIGSAFVPQKPEMIPAPAFELIPLDAILVDANIVTGGGNPNAAPPAAPPQSPPPQETPRQPEPKPVTPPAEPERAVVPAQPSQRETPVVKPPDRQLEPEPAGTENNRIKPEARPRKPEPPARTFDLGSATKTKISPTSNKNSNAADSSASKAEADRLADQRRQALAGVARNIGSRIGDATEVGIPGPGGQAYVGYGIFLRKLYEDAWVPPGAARDNEPVVEVEVVIARDGKVLSSRITKRSGNSRLDRSVQEVLGRVKQAPPFPAGATDEKRTFKINFNLTNKLGLG